MRAILAFLAGALLILPASALAQQAGNGNGTINIQPSAKEQAPGPEPVEPKTTEEHLLGDWGGVRTSLGDLGIDLQIGDTNEFAGNVNGGQKQLSTNAGQFTIQADIDGGKLAGLDGFAVHFAQVARYGSSTSAGMGDQLSPVQEIYGAGGNVVDHLVYLYFDQELAGGRISVAVGRWPVGNDFTASPYHCNFMNNLLCGNPKALVGQIGGFSAWPDSTFGGRVRIRPTDNTYFQIGIWEVSQSVYTNGNGFRTNWKWDGSADSGVEIPAEAAWLPVFRGNLPGHWKIGMAYDSSQYATFDQQAAVFNPSGAAGNPSTSASGSTNGQTANRSMYYALVDQMLFRQGAGPTDGFVLLAAWVHDDPSTLVRSDQVYAGFVDHHFWDFRPADSIGFLVNYTRVSGSLHREEEQYLDAGLPFPSSIAATGVQTDQWVLEATYTIHVMKGVNFEPDVQYMIRPNAQANIPDALVLGFRSTVQF